MLLLMFASAPRALRCAALVVDGVVLPVHAPSPRCMSGSCAHRPLMVPGEAGISRACLGSPLHGPPRPPRAAPARTPSERPQPRARRVAFLPARPRPVVRARRRICVYM